MPKQYKLKNYKFTLIILVAALNILGIMLVGSARPEKAAHWNAVGAGYHGNRVLY